MTLILLSASTLLLGFTGKSLTMEDNEEHLARLQTLNQEHTQAEITSLTRQITGEEKEAERQASQPIIFSSEIFEEGKEFVGSSQKPEIYVEFHKTLAESGSDQIKEEVRFDIFTYPKSKKKKIGQINAHYSLKDRAIQISSPSFKENIEHGKEALETVIALFRGRHLRHHFSCETSFWVPLNNWESELLKSIGFKKINEYYQLPFKSLDLDKFQEFDLKRPRKFKNPDAGNQYPFYGPIEYIIFEDLKNFPKSTAHPLSFCDIGAGTGLFVLRLLEKTGGEGVNIIYNELDPDNIRIFQSFIDKNQESSYKKEMLQSIDIIPGNLFSLKDNATFMNKYAQGIHMISLMNVLHFLSPLQMALCMGIISEYLIDGGKFYMCCDTARGLLENEYGGTISQLLKNCVSEQITKTCVQMNPQIVIDIAYIRILKLMNFFEEQGLPFPMYFNEKIIGHKLGLGLPPISCRPSIDLIKEISQLVGFTLTHFGMIDVRVGGETLQISPVTKEGKDSKSWFVFEKDTSNPLIAKGAGNFRNSPSFKDFINRTLKADKQMKKIAASYDIQPTLVYPFMRINEKHE